MTETNEITIFEQDKIKITNLRAIIGTKTYAMSNITSVSRKKRARSDAPVWWTVFGVLVAMLGFSNIRELWSIILFGLAIAILGVVAFRNSKTTYILRIGSASGEADILESFDRAYIKKIAEATSDAIVRRG